MITYKDKFRSCYISLSGKIKSNTQLIKFILVLKALEQIICNSMSENAGVKATLMQRMP